MLHRAFQAASAAFLVIAMSQLGFAAATAVATQQIKPKKDCNLVNGNCGNANQSCSNAGGSCSTGGVDGEDGWYDPLGDGCGCQV